MNLLLDTHVLLWSLNDPARLRAAHRDAIASPENRVWVSSISIWELTVKLQLGKLEIDGELAAGIAAQDFEIMPFTAEHAYAVAELPHHHRDPFDRALMAQARSTKMPLVSTDTVIWRYSGQVELLAM